MGGTTHAAVTAAAVTPSSTPTRVPRVIAYTLRGYSTMEWPRGDGPRRMPGAASGRQVGKERGLRGAGGGSPAAPRPGGLGGASRRLGGGALALRPHPTLLVGDLIPLLDQQEVDQPRQRVGEELEVLVPVPRRVGQRLHLLGREHERPAVAFAGRQPELLDDARPGDAGWAGHATPSSRRIMRAASTIERSFEIPTQRGVSHSPQSGTSQRRAAGMCLSAKRTRSATSSGVSTRKALTSITPTATSLSVGNSLQSSISLISRFAYSKTNCLTRASSSRGYSGRYRRGVANELLCAFPKHT